jgi:CheY-like chemotaxis protein
MSGPQKTILAVDDERDITEMLTLLLESEGYRVLTASGGKAALEILEGAQPDLILLDIMMPGIDGHQVCRAVREKPALAAVPVLMLTAKNDIAHIAQAVDEGADGFIVKPFEVDAFLRILRMRLEGKAAEFYRSSQPGAAPEHAPEHPAGAARPVVPSAEEERGTPPRRALGDDERIIFLELIEPEDVFSVATDACRGQQHTLISLWQEEVGERRLQTTALFSVQSTTHFGDLLNCIFGCAGVQVIHCFIYRGMAEIPHQVRNRVQ